MMAASEPGSAGRGRTGQPRVGFVGLGRMGEPMALNLLRAGTELLVWNRSRPALDRLAAAGALVVSSAAAVLRSSDITFLMLASEEAIDAALGRGTPAFQSTVADRLLISTGTTSPGYSRRLAGEVSAAGGRYVEAPVSGSRRPAEAGTLVGVLAGGPDDVALASRLMAPMCADVFACGPVPAALRLKLAVNLFLITMVTALAEAVHLARSTGVDPDLLAAVLDAGPMASAVSRGKLAKLLGEDFATQASIEDVWMNARLVAAEARGAGAATPLLDQSLALLAETAALGHGGDDMVAVLRGIEGRAAHAADEVTS